MAEPTQKQSIIRRLRDFLFRPSSLSLTAVVAIGMFSGLVFWGGFNTGMEATNSMAFCTSCHEMRDTVFQEYKETIHFKNRSACAPSAPTATCEGLDAQVRAQGPGEPGALRKFVTESISTPEKFETKRMSSRSTCGRR